MTPESQRIAIAEAVGWKPILISTDFNGNPWPGANQPPDYLTDLNAMNEAEKVLNNEQKFGPNGLGAWMEDVLSRDLDRTHIRMADFICASAAQRAEAFLRALGKWDDSK